MTEQTLLNYAQLVLKIGVNLQKEQGLYLACPIEKKEVAYAFSKVAYSLGASIVKIRWDDEATEKLDYEFAKTSTLAEVPKWFVDSKNYLVEKGFCYVAIASENPSLLKDIPQDKISTVLRARSKALKKYSDAVMKNKIRWCVVSVPTLEWAKQVYPNQVNAEELLEDAIIKSMRLDTLYPTTAWEEHITNLEKRANFLNKKNFEYLRFKSKNGTDLTVGLAENHVWLSAKEKALDGINFVANMPTEEVFTSPHKFKVNGVVKSSLPLAENGKIIEDFSLTFKNGKIVDFDAEKGYKTLKNIIETDKGTYYLGEVALIGKSSPIAKLNTLFYNTLFDENASCHLALGKAYPTTIKNGENLSKKELSLLGANDSVEHVDFMIGTDDLEVFGIEKNGKETAVFINGDWVI
ncbi:MAG: aminopeptidase [Clostridia bacterium]|nr:aminopeptidase [Clostridia bacterium]